MVTEKQKTLIALDPIVWEDLYKDIGLEKIVINKSNNNIIKRDKNN
jgi:hypothetical protein